MALTNKPYEGYINYPKGTIVNKYMVFEDKVHQIHRVVVYRFTMGDVEDPELYAAEPIINWQNSEMGKWVMERSIEVPMWHQQQDYNTFGYTFAITAYLKDTDYTFWTLKWGST